MNTVLIVVTLVEVLLLVVVLAAYLIKIAATLRNVSKTLGLVTFGVRAIESQTSHIGPRVLETNAALEQVASALESVVGDKAERPTEDTTAAGATGSIESGSDVPRPGSA